MLADATIVRVAPVAGIPVVHEMNDDIELERSSAVDWDGTDESAAPLIIRHERGDVSPNGMRSMLSVPPWCTFYLDGRGEPAALFHPVFGEVDRLLCCEEPGTKYVVKYGAAPSEPVVALQSELTAYSFALAARGAGLIAHACAFVTAAGKGVLCPGVSGTGKTTLATLLRAPASAVRVLTDDRAVVTLSNRLTLWGSPWPGAARVASGGSAPLTTVVFIRHADAMALRPVSPRDAFRRILNTLSVPLWEPARCGRALEIIDAVVSGALLIEASYPATAEAAGWIARELDLQPLGASRVR